MRSKLAQRRNGALVTLDTDDALGAGREQRSRQPAWARTDFDHRYACEWTGRAGDASCQIEVEQKVLAE
jgi:hypothetical protein